MKIHPGGLLLTFEGPDKAGKTTQIKRLADRLRTLGYGVTETREPGGTPLGEELRRLVMQYKGETIAPACELLLFGASRAQLMQHVILPRLAAGEIVLCDRFIDSTTAYQGGARAMDQAFIQAMHALTLQGRWPDRTFLLDLSVAESSRRLDAVLGNSNAHDRFEQEKQNFHEAVRQAFLDIARDCPERVRRLDASLSPDAVSALVWQEVTRVLD